MSQNNTFNPQNERIKHRYFKYLSGAMRKSPKSVDQARKCLMRFEEFTHYGDFKTFSPELAMAFKEYIFERGTKRTGEVYSQNTINAILGSVHDFYVWLVREPNFKRIKPNDITYLKPSLKEMSKARAQGFRDFPTPPQVKHVILQMPSASEIDKRNRALIAFVALTGMRDGAICGLKLKHLNITRELVHQDPRELETKFSKEIFTYFYPVDPIFKQIFLDYIKFLQKEKLFGLNEPLFPKTEVDFDGMRLSKSHWRGAGAIRKIFAEAVANAGITPFVPHTFRHMLVHYGEEICASPEEFKAWSQSLGHEFVRTTFMSYGKIEVYRQGEVIKRVGKSR